MNETYKKMKCFNRMTGEFKGYVGTLRNYVTLVPDKEHAASIKWASEDKNVYLEKDTSPSDRFLGLAERGYAGWGLKGGWRNPVLFNKEDGTIALKDDLKKKLYGPYETLGNDYLCWSEDENNQNILRFELED